MCLPLVFIYLKNRAGQLIASLGKLALLRQTHFLVGTQPGGDGY